MTPMINHVSLETPAKKKMDTIFKEFKHFHSFKRCAKSKVILLKITQKGSPGPQIFVKLDEYG